MDADGGGMKHPQQLFFDNVSPATRLLEKRRQMYEVQDALENQKARFAKEEEQFRKKEEQLRAKDLQLQHQLFRFNKFLQDNEAKRRRAETRAAEEAAQIRQKEEEIRDLEKQLEECKQLCGELEEEVSRNMKYEEFLERVKDTDDNYSEIQDLVTRYETLESANKDLMELQTTSENRIEELRNEFQSYRKQQEMETLAFTNQIALLSSELDEVVKTRQELENKVDAATQENSKHSLYFGQILMSVENLYIRCTTKRRNIQHAAIHLDEEGGPQGRAAEGPVEEGGEDSFKRKKDIAVRQLKVILAYLKDFKDITDTLKRERRGEMATKRQAGQVLEAVKLPDMHIKFEDVKSGRGGGDKASQHSSSSQGNTRDLSRPVHSAMAAGASATIGDNSV